MMTLDTPAPTKANPDDAVLAAGFLGAVERLELLDERRLGALATSLGVPAFVLRLGD